MEEEVHSDYTRNRENEARFNENTATASSVEKEEHVKSPIKPPLSAKPKISCMLPKNASNLQPTTQKENVPRSVDQDSSVCVEDLEFDFSGTETEQGDTDKNSKKKLPSKSLLNAKLHLLQHIPRNNVKGEETNGGDNRDTSEKIETNKFVDKQTGNDDVVRKTLTEDSASKDFDIFEKCEDIENSRSPHSPIEDDSALTNSTKPTALAKPQIAVDGKHIRTKPLISPKPMTTSVKSNPYLVENIVSIETQKEQGSATDFDDNSSDKQSSDENSFDQLDHVPVLRKSSYEECVAKNCEVGLTISSSGEEHANVGKNQPKCELSDAGIGLGDGVCEDSNCEDTPKSVDIESERIPCRAEVKVPDKSRVYSPSSENLNVIHEKQQTPSAKFVNNSLENADNFKTHSNGKPVQKPRRPPPLRPLLTNKMNGSETSKEKKDSVHNIVKTTPLDRRMLPAIPKRNEEISLIGEDKDARTVDNNELSGNKDKDKSSMHSNEQSNCERKFSENVQKAEIHKINERGLKTLDGFDAEEKQDRKGIRRLAAFKDKPDGFKIPFVRKRNKEQLREPKEERKSCPPLPDKTTEVIKHDIQESIEDKWKCKSFSNAIEAPKDIAEGELMRRLKEQRRKTESQGGNHLENQQLNKKVVNKVINEDEEFEGAVLFDHVLVVKLKQGNNGLEPFIHFRFPPKQKLDKELDPRVASIPQFCFPDLKSGMSEQDYTDQRAGYHTNETFSFVLTDMVGKRHFGYCRQIQVATSPSAKRLQGPQLPEVYCIVSPYGLFGLYSQILNEVERQCAFSSTSVFSFLKAVLSHSLPRPGRSLEISFFSGGSQGIKSVTLHRGGDSAMHEHVDFKLLFDSISIDIILLILSSLLLERRIILSSSQLSLLSTCCHAFISLLYPFQWQHTYIPVLPHQLLDMCCLPTPYLLGVLSGSLADLDDLPLDEVVIVDLDAGSIIRNDEGELSSNFPTHIQNTIDSSLTTVLKKETRDMVTGNREQIITEIFIDAYLQLIGNFQEFYSDTTEDGSGFQNLKFAKSSKSKDLRRFLKQFIKTQAFQSFIRQYKSQKSDNKGLFEERLQDWHSSRKQKTSEGGWHRVLGKLKGKQR